MPVPVMVPMVVPGVRMVEGEPPMVTAARVEMAKPATAKMMATAAKMMAAAAEMMAAAAKMMAAAAMTTTAMTAAAAAG